MNGVDELEYIAGGIYGKRTTTKRQFHLDVPDLLRRHGLHDSALNRRWVIAAAFNELREAGLQTDGFLLIARQAGMGRVS